MRAYLTSQPTIRNSIIVDSAGDGIYASSCSPLTVHRCEISHCASEGVYAYATSVLIDSTAVDSCGSYPIHLDGAWWLQEASEANTFAGNAIQAIALGSRTIAADLRLINYGVDYHILGDLQVQASNGVPTLTVDPGLRLEFASQTGLRIGIGSDSYGGQLHCFGSPEAPITFTPAPGVADWKGLYFDRPTYGAGVSTLEYCTIEGAGGSWGGGVTANVRAYLTSQPTIRNSIILSSAATGIYLQSAPITIQRSLVNGCGGDGIYTTGSAITLGGDSLSCNQFENNAGYELRLGSSHDVSCRYNWWGSADPGVIAAEIYDDADDPSLGIAYFDPHSEEACSDFPLPEPFHLLSPADGARVLTLNPTMTWHETTGGQDMHYELEYAANPELLDPTIIFDIEDTTHTIASDLSDGQTNWWRVKAKNGLGLSRYSLDTWSVLANIPPSVPDPIYPLSGEPCTLEEYLVWLASTDQGGSAVTYQIQIDDDSTFISPEIDQDGIGGEGWERDDAVAILLGDLEGAGGLASGTTYFWRVQSFDFYPDSSGYSPETTCFQFDSGTQGILVTEMLPTLTRLRPLTPNPAQAQARVSFDLAAPEEVAIDILDVAGRRVRALATGRMNAGTYALAWDLQDGQQQPVGGGVYWVRFRAGARRDVARLLILR